MIEHVRGGNGARSRATRYASRAVVLPVLSVFPIRGPLSRIIPLLDVAAGILPASRRVSRSRVLTDNWRAEHVVPLDAEAVPGAVIYMHGGAFFFGGLRTHRTLVDSLAVRSGLAVLNVDYRMHPRGVVADALDDCLDAFAWLVEQGVDPSTIVLAGDSAGGHLAFAAALSLRERGIRPAGIVAFSPWVDFDHSTKTCHPNRFKDAMIPAHRLRGVGRAVLGVDVVDESHSTVNADLRGLPPVLMLCAADEVLRIDTELMTKRLRQAGVPVTAQVWDGMVHAFPAVPVPSPDILRARQVAASFMRDAVAATATRAEVVA